MKHLRTLITKNKRNNMKSLKINFFSGTIFFIFLLGMDMKPKLLWFRSGFASFVQSETKRNYPKNQRSETDTKPYFCFVVSRKFRMPENIVRIWFSNIFLRYVLHLRLIEFYTIYCIKFREVIYTWYCQTYFVEIKTITEYIITLINVK